MDWFSSRDLLTTNSWNDVTVQILQETAWSIVVKIQVLHRCVSTKLKINATDATTQPVSGLEPSSPEGSQTLSPRSSPSISPSPPSSPNRSPRSESQVPPAKKPCLSRETDVGVFVAEKSSGEAMTYHDKYQLVVQHFNPDPSYEYPRSEKTGRHFMHSWLLKCPWLEYSKSCNGGFCLPCVLFAKGEGFRSSPDLFVQKPLGDAASHFIKALELLRQHNERLYHKRAVVSLEEFMKVMSNSPAYDTS